jgi:hypothetical protein
VITSSRVQVWPLLAKLSDAVLHTEDEVCAYSLVHAGAVLLTNSLFFTCAVLFTDAVFCTVAVVLIDVVFTDVVFYTDLFKKIESFDSLS